MPTIVTVHGTFASGEATGSRWWQKGSRCEETLRRHLVGTSGELAYHPFVWDGQNSERSRREAARRLLWTFKELEQSGEPYIAIGHSHGGSVIAFALQLAQREKLELPHLKRWITVGTPFISFEKKRWLYSRGDVFVKGVYVMAVLLILAVTARYLLLGGPPGGMWDALFVSAATLAGLAFATYLIAFYAEGDAPDWKMLDANALSAVDNAFSGRWTAYWHPADEAILGLRHAHQMQSRLFPADFATQRYQTLLIPGLPLLAFLLALAGVDAHVAKALSLTASQEAALSPYITQDVLNLADWYATPQELGSTSLVDRTVMTILAIPVLAARLLRWLGSESPQMLAMMIVGAAMGYVYLAKGVARLLSIPTSWALNALTLSQFRSLVDGVDLASERAVGCGVRPAWGSAATAPLPREVCEEITVMSDRAASAALPKFRSALGELALSEKLDDVRARFSDYLTWDELIHTAYFNSPKFMALLAETCAGTEGFARRVSAAVTRSA